MPRTNHWPVVAVLAVSALACAFASMASTPQAPTPAPPATAGAATVAPAQSTQPAPAKGPSPGPVSFVPYPEKQVLVLMYHQVTDTPDSVNLGAGHYGPAISPKEFEADLRYLRDHGFRAVDPLRALEYLDGRLDASALPDHPYAVTFDDGFVSAWTEATPILQRQHVRAMMFVEAKRIDLTPGRLTSPQIRAMATSGSWEIESHGFMGHWALQIGPKPTDLSPYWYANLAWLPAAGRLETPAEFETRVAEDLTMSASVLSGLSKTPVTVFAYPSGEYGQNVPLPAGADPDVFAGEQGHSNATGLTPHILAALRRAGFSSAFAVVVPGTEAAAAPADASYLFPRIGEGPQKADPRVAVLTDGSIKLPSISPDYHWVDCRSVAAGPSSIWVAANAAPYIYQMDAMSGKVENVVEVGALQAGRQGQPVLVAALMQAPDGSLLAYQQKGWWDGGQARLVSFRIVDHQPSDVKTSLLDESAAWFVGMALVNGRTIGMDENGALFEIDGGKASQLAYSFPNDSPGWKQDDVGRFAGLAYAHGLLYAADRKTGRLLGLDPQSGALKESSALPPGVDIRGVGGDDELLWLVNYADNRRTLFRLRSTESPSHA